MFAVPSKMVQAIRVGWLLGRRQIQRSNIWVTVLIVVIMALTFMSNLVISGILIGLVEGGKQANKEQYTGDIFLSELANESVIQNSSAIRTLLDRLEQVDDYSMRYTAGVTVEANYKTRRDFNALPNAVGTALVGIDPLAEDRVTNLSNAVIEGEYLNPNESGKILVGAVLLERYSAFSDLFEPLKNVYPGDRIKVSVSPEGTVINLVDPNTTEVGTKNVQEFIVKGIIDTKVGEVSQRVFVTQTDFIRLTGRSNRYVNEIAVRSSSPDSIRSVQTALTQNNIDRYAKIQTADEAIPKFLNDIQQTFGLLGLLIGGIISSVGAVTIFIVIYINALVRRKQIGILKGIGVHGGAIQFAYIVQAFLYAIIGIAIASALVFGVLVPFIARNPIDFPFSDGIIAISPGLFTGRVFMVLLTSFFAGLVPAWLIVRRNTLDSILGR